MKKTLCLKSGFVYQFHVSVSLLALLLKIDNFWHLSLIGAIDYIGKFCYILKKRADSYAVNTKEHENSMANVAGYGRAGYCCRHVRT